jgi:predicted metal-binding membrane protein
MAMTPAAHERWRVRLPLIVFAGISWLAILFLPKGQGVSFCDTSVWSSISTDKLLFVLDGLSTLTLVWSWVLMVVAMMAPMLTRNLAHVQARAIPSLRAAGTILFLIGYLSVWFLAGVPAALILISIELLQPAAYLTLIAALAIALVWQFSPVKQSCLNRCHRTPSLAGSGRRFVFSIFCYGFAQGIWCVGTCWALMIVGLLSGEAHILVMALLSAILLAERFDKPMRPGWSVRYPTVVLRMTLFRLERLVKFSPVRVLNR